MSNQGAEALRHLQELLFERTGYVHAASAFKTSTAAVRAPDRVEAVIANVRNAARENGLDADVVGSTWREVVSTFIAYESQVFTRGAASRAQSPNAGSLDEIRARIDALDCRIIAALAATQSSDPRSTLLSVVNAALGQRTA